MLVLVIFLLSNRAPVELSFWPFGILGAPPVGGVVIAAAVLGFLAGLAAHLPKRLAARRRMRRAEKRAAELEARLGAATAPGTSLGTSSGTALPNPNGRQETAA